MKLKDKLRVVELLYKEWDLGKTPSKSKGKICSWIYLMEILEWSECMYIKRDEDKLIGICSYAKYNSKKYLLRKRMYKLLKNILIISPMVKNKKEMFKYLKDYDYTPMELQNHFDGEINILILDKNYRGKGVGKEMLLQVFKMAKKDNVKNIQILSDESCNYKFYESLGCKQIYKTKILNDGPNILENKKFETGYIYEKIL